MDLEEEWELLPDEGFLEINDDGGKKIYSRKYTTDGSTTGAISVFHMNYFNPEFVENTTRMPNQLLPAIPIDDLEPTTLKPLDDDDDDDRELVKTKIPGEIKVMAPPPPLPATSSEIKKIKSLSTGLLLLTSDEQQDPVSQVFFKKMKETEFVDMKVDSPKSNSGSGSGSGSGRGMIMPQQIEGTGERAFQFEAKGEHHHHHHHHPPPREAKDVVDSEMMIKNNNMELVEGLDEDGGVLNVLKWSLSGIGAICSFGVAAATFCVVIFSSSSHHRNKHPRQNQKLQFQILSNDKRMVQQGSKLNGAISAVRGVSINRAHITFGGYYDASSV